MAVIIRMRIKLCMAFKNKYINTIIDYLDAGRDGIEQEIKTTSPTYRGLECGLVLDENVNCA